MKLLSFVVGPTASLFLIHLLVLSCSPTSTVCTTNDDCISGEQCIRSKCQICTPPCTTTEVAIENNIQIEDTHVEEKTATAETLPDAGEITHENTSLAEVDSQDTNDAGNSMQLESFVGVWHFSGKSRPNGGSPLDIKGVFALSIKGEIELGVVYGRVAGANRYTKLGDMQGGSFAINDGDARTIVASFKLGTSFVDVDVTAANPPITMVGSFKSSVSEGDFQAELYNSSSQGWRCGISFKKTLDGCDCGCKDRDLDCAAGCTEPGCRSTTCDFCFDQAGILTSCSTGSKPPPSNSNRSCRFTCSGCKGTTSCTGTGCESCSVLCAKACQRCGGKVLSCN